MPLSIMKFAPGLTDRWLAATVRRKLGGTAWRVRLETMLGKPWGWGGDEEAKGRVAELTDV